VHGVVAVSILTALLPRMSAAAAENRLADVATSLSFGTRLSSVVLVPATAGYLVLGVPLAVTAFQFRNFTPAQAHDAGLAVMAAGIGLVPFAVSQMQIFAFYAMRDTKTPALLNIPVVAAKLAFDLGVWLLVPSRYVVIGLFFGNTLSYLVAATISGWLLRRRLGPLDLTRTAQTLLRLSGASVLAGLAAWAVAAGVHAGLGAGKLGSVTALVTGGIVLVAVFAVGAVLLRVREVTELWGTVRTKLPGRR
jgi:putative peptidoglycan lipid II flippase